MNEIVCDTCKQHIVNNIVCLCKRTWYINSNYISWINNLQSSGGVVMNTIENYKKYLNDGVWRSPHE